MQREVPKFDAIAGGAAAMPGIERYKAAGFPTRLRGYQKPAVAFLAVRAYAMLCDAMRLGKTVSGLAAAELIDAKRVLVLAPSTAKPVWRDEVAKWLGRSATIVTLYGRGADEVHVYCHSCAGEGKLKDGRWCPDCRAANGSSYGYRLISPRALPRLKPLTIDPTLILDLEQYRAIRGLDSTAAEALRDETPAIGAEWDARLKVYQRRAAQADARVRVRAVLEEATHVLVNYDLLVAQTEKDATGKLFIRDDLPGWAPTLAEILFTVALLDELHGLRGFSTNQARRGQTRRERTKSCVAGIDYVWGFTGTPIYGYLRDLWGQVDTISNGLFGTYFQFTARYCLGGKSEYGWKADGRSEFEPELIERLKYVMLKRSRADVALDLPAKIRQTIRIDRDECNAKLLKDAETATRAAIVPDARKTAGKGIGRALTALTPLKIPAVVENVLGEVAEGGKVIVFAMLRATVDSVNAALQEAMTGRDHAVKMREVGGAIWACHGEQSADIRAAYAKAFRDHTGGGIFLATIDAVQVAVSLRGAQSVHFVELHWNPAALLQAEDRPYEPGTNGLTVVYYVVPGSVDSAMLDVVLPKMETLEQVVKEKGASEFRIAHETIEVEEDLDDVLARLSAHLKDEVAL